jgi:hypothetical protein
MRTTLPGSTLVLNPRGPGLTSTVSGNRKLSRTGYSGDGGSGREPCSCHGGPVSVGGRTALCRHYEFLPGNGFARPETGLGFLAATLFSALQCVRSFAEIAEREGKVERHIRLLTPLAFVPPRALAAIIDGTGPHDATVTALAQASGELGDDDLDRVCATRRPSRKPLQKVARAVRREDSSCARSCQSFARVVDP